MVRFDQDFLGPCALGGDTLRPSSLCSSTKFASVTCEIDCAASEVPRSRYATHATIPAWSPSTRGDDQSRMALKESQDMESGVWGQSLEELALTSGEGLACRHAGLGEVRPSSGSETTATLDIECVVYPASHDGVGGVVGL